MCTSIQKGKDPDKVPASSLAKAELVDALVQEPATPRPCKRRRVGDDDEPGCGLPCFWAFSASLTDDRWRTSHGVSSHADAAREALEFVEKEGGHVPCDLRGDLLSGKCDLIDTATVRISISFS